MFDPNKYIEQLGDGLVLCTNPLIDGGMSAITVNLNASIESKLSFREAIQRMVLAKLFSPKFAEVILLATQMNLEADNSDDNIIKLKTA